MKGTEEDGQEAVEKRVGGQSDPFAGEGAPDAVGVEATNR